MQKKKVGKNPELLNKSAVLTQNNRKTPFLKSRTDVRNSGVSCVFMGISTNQSDYLPELFCKNQNVCEGQCVWFQVEQTEVSELVNWKKQTYKCTFFKKRGEEHGRFLQIQYVQSNPAGWRKLSTYQLLRLSIFTYRYTINKQTRCPQTTEIFTRLLTGSQHLIPGQSPPTVKPSAKSWTNGINE